MEFIQFIIFFATFIIALGVSYVSLQRIDFSKMFKANSTTQIRCLILMISLAISFSIASGLSSLIDLFIKGMQKAI